MSQKNQPRGIDRASLSVSQKLSSALAYHQSGKLKRAETAYRKILHKHPDNDEALHLLGVLLHQTDRNELAEQFIRRAIKFDSTNDTYCFNLAEVQRANDRPQASIINYRKAIEYSSSEADYYFGLGNALYDTGDTESAVEVFRQAASLVPDDAEIYNNLGNALADTGELDEAIASYRTAISLQADNADSYYNLAVVLDDSNATEAAIRNYRQALKLKPELPDALLNLAKLYRDIGDFLLATNCYQALLKINPQHASACSLLGDCLAKLDRYEEAIEQINKALAIEADNAEAHFNLGVCLQAMGCFDEAAISHRKALALKPDLTEAAYNLVMISSESLSDIELEKLASRSSDYELDDNVHVNLHFALAKAYHDRKRYKDAFVQLQSGNDIKARTTPFNPEAYNSHIERIIATHDVSFFKTRKHFGLDTEVPVFIVGMPRSGSTLVEQIISSHPRAHGAGELNDMRILSKRLPEILGLTLEDPEILTEMTDDIAKNLATEHLKKLSQLSGGAERVCDKMLGNFLKLGLIYMMFPRARVVHCVRNPMDTLLSCYFQNFARGLRFTYKLEHLGLAYRGYLKMMDHWRKVLPLQMIEVQYEHLIYEQEQISRELIDFCGLDWDKRCLAFYQQQRGVKTASFWQVRQPIYKSSVSRWRHYETQLQPLIEALRVSTNESIIHLD